MRYAGLLRAVNVGRRQVPMARLRALLGEHGFTDVQTLMASGNVVFSTDRTDVAALEAELSSAVEAEFGFPVPVLLRSAADLDRVIAENPFPEAVEVDPKLLHVAFASAALPADAYRDIDRSAFEPDDLAVGTHEVYVWYANGAGRSKLAVDVAATRHIAFTARNWNTVLKVRDLLSAP
jgi:uncharacterized protein (DUF1697 family)